MTIKQDLTNVNFTPNGMIEIRGLCIHSMWGTYAGSIAWFKNPTAKASAHYCISKDGEITQTVKDSDMAWHAGIFDEGMQPEWTKVNSNYYNPNRYCIGIEFEDNRDKNWRYPDPQRKAGAWLVRLLIDKYTIPRKNILLHKDLNPSRRSDPVGAFSFEWLLSNNMNNEDELTKCRTARESHWNDLIAIRQALSLPEDAPRDTVLKSIAGIKGDSNMLRTKNAELEREVKNRIEQLANEKEVCQSEKKLLESFIKAEKKKAEEMASVYNEMKAKWEAVRKEAGTLNIELEKCKASKSYCHPIGKFFGLCS